MTINELEGQAQRFYQALAAGDRAVLDELLHPQFVGTTTRGLPLNLGGVYQGPEQMRRHFWGTLARHYQARAEIEQIVRVAEDQLQVVGVYTGHGIKSGTPLDARFVHLLRFRGGRLLALEQITDSGAWQAALTPVATLDVQVEEGIALIQLDRASANNGINAQMARELLEVARRCAADPSLRVVVLQGKGKSFTVGGDIDFLSSVEADALPAMLGEMTTHYHEALRIFNRLPVPVIAAVQGVAAGGGLGLMYCADLVLAAQDCRFALGFSALGLSMDGANSWFLPRLVGARRAAELYFENRVLSAQEALEWGLVNRVVPVDQLKPEAMACARRLAQGAATGFAQARQLLRQSWDKSLSEQLEAETDALCRSAAKPEVQQALKALAAKRAQR